MRTLYETLDGTTFGDITDAEKHERALLEQVQMWDWNKNRTENTAQARLIRLTGEGAGAMLRAMMANNPDEYETLSPDQIDDNDNGWFYWDEYGEQYRYIDSEIIDLIIAANHQI
jgi:hypothetical protein